MFCTLEINGVKIMVYLKVFVNGKVCKHNESYFCKMVVKITFNYK
jgi:hypothetical protein